MPFRLDPAKYPGRTKVQFTTAAWLPYTVYQACLATGTNSNVTYIQTAVCEALARDLDIPLERLIDNLPEPMTRSRELRSYPRDPSVGRLSLHPMVGPANTVEEVR